MKKSGIIIQAVLAVAVIGLYILYFTGKHNSSSSSTSSSDSTSVAKSGAIAFVEIDSVMANYNMAKDMLKEIESKGKQYDTELNSKTKSLQQNYQDLQYKAQRGLEVRSKLEQMGQQLQADEQNLYKLRDSYGAQLQEENAVMLRKSLNSIMEYIKEYNKSKGYTFVLGNTFDGKILYADPSVDITKEIIKGINEKYDASKKGEKK
jgi:outer membrane protein